MADFKFACPFCAQHIACREVYCGRQMKCPSCGKEIVIPAADAPAPTVTRIPLAGAPASAQPPMPPPPVGMPLPIAPPTPVAEAPPATPLRPAVQPPPMASDFAALPPAPEQPKSMLDSFWTISMGAGLVIGLIGFAVAGKGGATLGGMVQFGFFAAVGVFATCCTFAPRRVLANPRIAATIGTTNLKVARAVCAIAMTICGSMAVLVLAGLLLDSKGPVVDQGEKAEEVRVAEYRARVEMQRARAAESPAPVPGEIPSSAPPGESLPPPPVTDGALQVSDFALEATTRNPLNVTFVMRIQGGRGKNRDVWGGIGDLEVIKKFATQAKGPMANRLGLLELNGPGFYIAPCKEWNPVPEKPGLSRCRLNFEKVALSRSSALVSVIVFDDEGGVALQTSQVDFETGKAEAAVVSRAEGGR